MKIRYEGVSFDTHAVQISITLSRAEVEDDRMSLSILNDQIDRMKPSEFLLSLAAYAERKGQ